MVERRQRILRRGWALCVLLALLTAASGLWFLEPAAEDVSGDAAVEAESTAEEGPPTSAPLPSESVSSLGAEAVRGAAEKERGEDSSLADLEVVGRIRGRFVEGRPEGRVPIEGELRVELRRLGSSITSAESQEATVHADFDLVVRSVGEYELTAQTNDGRLGATIDGIGMSDGSDLDLGEVELHGRGEIVGRVVDEQNQPIAGALVTCADRAVVSTADGRFSIADALVTATRVEASAPGYLATTVAIARLSDANDASRRETLIRMRAAAVITGRVLDVHENVVPGAEIWHDGTTYVTDAGGRFRIENADAERAARTFVFARHPVAGSAEVVLDAAAENVIHLEVRAGARVRIEPNAAFDSLSSVIATRYFELPTGESGFREDHALQVSRDRDARELRLSPVEPGKHYRVEVTTKDDALGSVEFTVPQAIAPEGELVPRLELAAPRVLRGRVERTDGRSLVGARVRAFRVEAAEAAGGSSVPTARTDEDGRFELRPLAVVPYDIVVWPRAGAPFSTRIDGGTEITLREPIRATLEVAIEGFERGTRGFGVEVRHLVTREWVRRPLEGDGTVTFADLAPGSVRVAVTMEGHSFAEIGLASLVRQVDLVAGEATRVAFSASDLPTAQLVLRFVDTRGTARANVFVELVTQRSRERRFVVCDPAGVVRFDHLPRDRASLRVLPIVELACDFGSGTNLAIEIDRPVVERRVVTAIGSLEVKVVDATHRPRANASVSVEFVADGVSSYGGIRPAVTDESGIARFERLPAGSFRVRCEGDPGVLDVSVVDGEHTAIEFISAP